MRRVFGISLHVICTVLTGIWGAVVMQCEKSPVTPDENLYNLRITEVHYNPADAAGWDSDSLEFIELKNTGERSLDVGSIDFTQGIDYSFPVDAVIPPDSFYVIASNADAFFASYNKEPDGVFSGQLKNSGETIVIYDRLTESTIAAFTYGDSTTGWPVEADGDGFSLVPVDAAPEEISSEPEDWRVSVRPNGSPGRDDVKLPVAEELFNLRITEIHYHPQDMAAFGEDSLEFIELKNIGTTEVSLARAAFTDGISYYFSDTATIDAGGFVVLASNKQAFLGLYDIPPYDVYDGQLSNSGENIVLTDVLSGEPVITIEYHDETPWPGNADGDGYSLVPFYSNPDSNQNRATAWRCSYREMGSPGKDDPGVVVVNEIVSNPSTSGDDAIEVYNPGDVPVDISGWYLTDHKENPLKYKIPEGTVIKPGNYYVCTEDEFSSGSAENAFNLSAHGDDAYIVSDSSGCFGEGYCHGFTFGELEEGQSFGRYITASGDEVFTTLSAVTLGQKNSGPRVGPVIFTEIMYGSSDIIGDFVEITNIDYKEVRLYNPQHPENTWRIDGLSFAFPKSISIRPGESIVLLSDSLDVQDFRDRYKLDTDVQIFHFSGELENDKQLLTLMKPEAPYIDDSTSIVPYMIIDEVKYTSKKPWPKKASDTPLESIQRISGNDYGNDPAQWKSATANPGDF